MRAYEAVPLAAGPDDRASALASRLAPAIPGSALWCWLGPLLVTAFGAFLRFNRLSVPHAIVFDETYYAGDGYAILRHGVEINHVKNANALLASGKSTHILSSGGEFVVHPPFGKVLIAVGEWLFGLTPLGWRFSVAVLGSLAILMTARIARRMTRSTLLGCVAGLLLALDGLEFVLSRTAILDIFVMFWVLAAFGLLVIDRDRTRAALAAAAADLRGTDGPRLGFRWPLLLAGVCLGCACATKWNGVWFVPAFAALVVAWDLGARRAAGFGTGMRGTVRGDAPWLPVWFAVVPAVVYVVSWTGWFATGYGFDRNGSALNNGHPAGTIAAWLQYNKSMLGYGLDLQAYQPYRSNPLGWPVLARPPHRVLLLRGGVRPVPGDRHHAVPRADHRPGPGRAEPPGGRRGGGRRLPARGRRQLLLPVSGPRRADPPVQLLGGPHVVPQLDMTAVGARLCAAPGPRRPVSCIYGSPWLAASRRAPCLRGT